MPSAASTWCGCASRLRPDLAIAARLARSVQRVATRCHGRSPSPRASPHPPCGPLLHVAASSFRRRRRRSDPLTALMPDASTVSPTPEGSAPRDAHRPRLDESTAIRRPSLHLRKSARHRVPVVSNLVVHARRALDVVIAQPNLSHGTSGHAVRLSTHASTGSPWRNPGPRVQGRLRRARRPGPRLPASAGGSNPIQKQIQQERIVFQPLLGSQRLDGRHRRSRPVVRPDRGHRIETVHDGHDAGR